MDYDVIIAGAGAAGLAAAVSAARNNASVLVIERMDKPGKKILATGNGKCNYTNKKMDAGCYRSRCLQFIENFLKDCPYSSTIDFFEQLGIFPKEKNGYFYPNSEQASSVLEVLLKEASCLGVSVALSEEIIHAAPVKNGFLIKTNRRTLKAGAFVLACGGRAYSKLGSNGSGYRLAESLGHRLIPVVPALTGIRCGGKFGMKAEKFWKQVGGVRADGKVSLYIDGHEAASDEGQIQFTAYGLSGIPVFQISRYAAYALKEKRKVVIKADFFTAMTFEKFLELLKGRAAVSRGKSASEFLTGLFNSKLIPVFLRSAQIKQETAAEQLNDKQLRQLAAAVKAFEAEALAVNSFEEAQVCAGGVDTSEIEEKTMASKKVRGVFMAGEVLDIDGICGGYNLHFAWQSGIKAGKGAADYALRTKKGKRC